MLDAESIFVYKAIKKIMPNLQIMVELSNYNIFQILLITYPFRKQVQYRFPDAKIRNTNRKPTLQSGTHIHIISFSYLK